MNNQHFLMNLDINIDLNKRKLLCDYRFNAGIIPNIEIASNISQVVLNSIEKILLESL